MSVVESDTDAERGVPDLSFLERQASRTPGIPNMVSGKEPGPKLGMHQGDSKILTVGKGITVTGEISTCDTLIVEGTVSATLTSGRNLDILPGGTFSGSAEVANAIISGLFDGDLIVHDRLQVTASGRIQGTVRYGKLEIEAGGELNGDISVSASGE